MESKKKTVFMPDRQVPGILRVLRNNVEVNVVPVKGDQSADIKRILSRMAHGVSAVKKSEYR